MIYFSQKVQTLVHDILFQIKFVTFVRAGVYSGSGTCMTDLQALTLLKQYYIL